MSPEAAHEVSRRAFLAATGLATADVSRFAPQEAAQRAACFGGACRVLRIQLVGGPSQLETFDPKPAAPVEVRGPFGSIATELPGVRFSELFPRLAARASQLAVLRTVGHHETPTHEASQAWLTNVAELDLASHGCERWASVSICPSRSPAYGAPCRGADLARGCRAAVEELERGARMVSLKMFDRVARDVVTWDAHAQASGFRTTLADYRDHLAPAVDRALPALLDDLDARGLLAETLIVVGGEFGRTPVLNARGGRDHWTRCFSVLLAGGRLSGQVLGASDAWAGEPRHDAVSARRITATMACVLDRERLDDPDLEQPLWELW